MAVDPNANSDGTESFETVQRQSNWSELLPLFGSLFAVTVGIALFTAGNPPSGLPVPLVSVGFIFAGVLLWSGTALSYR